ncbi:hypothetical protein B0I35DRAFT_146500 [Stachybotrys elegans]|uniref:Protein YAE1 n=1 Tax=Stachybotrys elegans TaxID=80388 RepID=A0A8K0SFG7_9HYPO|nr:hypothetical protein B0I35DRAFT_146500 [Stachybotrys elegans]
MHFQPSDHPDEKAHLTHAGDDYLESQVDSNDPLDDVFGSGPESASELRHVSATSHPSDMNRLRTEHTTAGYREGVSTAKETSIQAGFDEGFSLGATIGLQAGQLLGTLEGIAEALRGDGQDAAAAADELLAAAQADLGKASIFSPQYWAPDGNWTYEVGDGEEVIFMDVALAHPLIRKWTEIVNEQMKRWKIEPSLLQDESGPRLEAMSDDHVATAVVPSTRKPLDW